MRRRVAFDHLDTEAHNDSDEDLLQRPLTVNALDWTTALYPSYGESSSGKGSKTRKLSRRLDNRDRGASETVETRQ